MEEKEFILKRRFRSNTTEKLIINENSIKLQNKGSVKDLSTSFEKESIKDYRFGMRWISFKLAFGREYQIFIRNKEEKTIKISFTSYFGRKKEELNKQYIEILNALWTYFFSNMVKDYLSRHSNNEEFSIGDVLFTKDNIVLSVSGIMKQKTIAIPWEKVRTKNYYSYFSIYSSEDPVKLNRGYSYSEDWNTNILYSVLRTILREKKIEIYR